MHFFIYVVRMMCCDGERNYLEILMNLYIFNFPEYEEVAYAVLSVCVYGHARL